MTAYTGNVLITAGGVGGGGGSILLVNTEVDHNRVRLVVTSTKGNASAEADSSGFHSEGPTTIKHSQFIGNSVAATSYSGSSQGAALVFYDGTDVSTISNSVVSGNSTRIVAKSGTASSWGAVVGNALAITGTRIIGNAVNVFAGSGTATVQGAGITDGGALTLTSAVVSKNTADAEASNGSVLGGGIWNDNPGGPLRVSQ
jgi:hypothetical protein